MILRYNVPFEALSILAILLFCACRICPSKSTTPEIAPQGMGDGSEQRFQSD